MRKITPGFPLPQERMSPLPFYWRHQSPEVVRWEWMHWPYDARQRKFYQIFTGRTQGSIWMDECYPPNLITHPDVNMQRALASDPKAWSLPHVDTTAGYMGEAAAFQSFLHMHLNYRPANPYTGRAADATDVDELYIAPRVTFDSCMYRISMNLPVSASVAGANYFIGYEINSQGGSTVMALHWDGTNNRYAIVMLHPAHWSHARAGYGAASDARLIPVTINRTNAWANYYFVWDPPVFRFIQPQAGQTDPMLYPDMTELSFDGIPRGATVQPFIANESSVLTTARQWLVGQWAIWPLYFQPNAWQVNKRSDAIEECGDHIAIWDTGGRGHILIFVQSRSTNSTYIIEWTGAGEDQMADYPEVRTWRRIDDADYTGLTDTLGIASMGLFNAARFIRVSVEEASLSDTLTTLETIAFTANRGG